MTLLEIRDWLNNLSDPALAETAKVLIDGKVYQITNWRLQDTREIYHSITKAEVIWEIS